MSGDWNGFYNVKTKHTHDTHRGGMNGFMRFGKEGMGGEENHIM